MFAEASLLFGDDGLVCSECELDARNRADVTRGVWTAIVVPIVSALGGTLFFAGMCVPYLNYFAVAVGSLFGILAILSSGWGVQIYMTANAAEVPGTQRGLLLGSSIIGIFWGLGLLALGCLFLAIVLLYTPHQWPNHF
ncbi:MAG: hypothetical protein HN348_14985 [Proteobacteria bacterium]|nr:hypothetical protein [Pseudomonadota bacterium]